MFVRDLHAGMGVAVAERTVLRKLRPGTQEVVPYDELQAGAPFQWETWKEVADRVALGNSLLAHTEISQQEEYEELRKDLAAGKTLLSGRHLQHGDASQPDRNMEVFTNCATSASTFALFYLLLNGSGVGRSYDDDMMLVNWDNAPTIRCVLSDQHPDFIYGAHMSVREAEHLYGTGRGVLWYKVPDTREGWAKAVELAENAAFEKIHSNKLLILDFTDVRPKGAPIRGMQNRPASGPVPLMNAIGRVARLKGAGLDPWLQAMYADHYLAECVLVGGARRAARMSTKSWKDQTVLDFIRVKRPIEYKGWSVDEVMTYRANCQFPPEPFLWSSNNSVTVDEEFWRLLKLPRGHDRYNCDKAKWARKVFKTIMECSYGDGTGEPGMINVDMLNQNDEGFEKLASNGWCGGPKYEPEEDTEVFMTRLAKRAKRKRNRMIVNPCGEIPLSLLGGYCTIGDLVPYHCEDLDDFERVARAVTRALIRVNSMGCLYQNEVRRTNRIGIGLTGVHEYAWKFFGLSFRDLIDEEKSKDFWAALQRVAKAVKDEADKYSKFMGLPAPHTLLTVKPAGTTSKLFGLTEGWHLPSMKFYVRWVQFRNDDPLVDVYRRNGYDTRVLKQYEGHTIVGFPTQPVLSDIMPEQKIVTAGEATPDEQFQWLRLGEKYWINGAGEDRGGQISYTLKYKPDETDFKTLKGIMLSEMPTVRCCSVMPQTDTSAYEYQPEETVTKAEFEATVARIKETLTDDVKEDVSREHVDCGGGACPVDFEEGKK